MRNFQKGSVLLVVTIMLAIVVSVGVYYKISNEQTTNLASQNIQTNTGSNTSSTTESKIKKEIIDVGPITSKGIILKPTAETQAWQHYTDESLGFTVKYPTDWPQPTKKLLTVY